MKEVFLFVIFLMVFSLQQLSISAESNQGVTVSSETAYFVQGRSFKTDVFLESQVDIVGFQWRFTYDDTVYALKDLDSDFELVENLEPGVITVNYVNTSEPLNGRSVVLTLTFDVLTAFNFEDERYLLHLDEDYRQEVVTLEGTANLSVVPQVNYELGAVKRAVLGDVNGDGVVSIIDVAMIQLFLAQAYELSDREKMVANVTNSSDGEVNLQDVMTMQLYIVGNIQSLEV